jgi:hypothetical protein
VVGWYEAMPNQKIDDNEITVELEILGFADPLGYLGKIP